jgi:hypothetical protein
MEYATFFLNCYTNLLRMTQAEIDTYREKIDQQLKEKVSEIESNISIIIIGALGFFLTINEKFIGLKEAKLGWSLLISVGLLLTSFFLFLFGKHLTTKYDRSLIDFLDNMEENKEYQDQNLLKTWEAYDKRLSKNRDYIYVTLAIAILFQLVFFFYNLMFTTPTNTEKAETLKIELTIKDSLKYTTEIKYVIDSTKNRKHVCQKSTQEKIDSKKSRSKKN